MPIIFKSSISEVRIAVARVVPEVITRTAEDAKNNIEHETERQHHGRLYPSRRESGVMHQASAPGESFATDTASLISTMKIEKVSPLETDISFNEWRWAVLEFGGGRIAPRPTIIPVIEHMRDTFIADVSSAILHALTEQELA